MISNVEILWISPNFMDFFYPRFQDSAYVYTPLVLKNEDFSSNLTIPLSNFGLSQMQNLRQPHCFLHKSWREMNYENTYGDGQNVYRGSGNPR